MKRILSLVLLLSVAVVTSCQSSSEINLEEAAYTITFTEEYLKQNGNNIKLLYPSVSGYPDSNKEKITNEDAAEYARSSYEKAGLIATEDGGYVYTASEGTVLLASEHFFSVLIVGTIESTVSGNTDIFSYVINYDLNRNTFITTESVISDYSSVANLFDTNAFQEDFGTSNLEENFSRHSLLEQYRTDYGIFPDVYFREGSFGILVDTLPSFGGYAGLLCDIRNVTPYLNTADPLIASLCGID